MSKEREAFEKLPEIKKRLDMKCVHFNGTWYATNPNMGNSFATASYLNGAWMTWQAKAQAVPEVLKNFCNEHRDPAWRGRLTEYDKGYSDCCIAVLEMIESQQPSSTSDCPDEP